MVEPPLGYTEITMPCDFKNPDWQKQIRDLALKASKQRTPDWIDYFVFREAFSRIYRRSWLAAFFWDNWTVWKALQNEKAGGPMRLSGIIAVHQNPLIIFHHPQGKHGVWYGEEAGANHKGCRRMESSPALSPIRVG